MFGIVPKPLWTRNAAADEFNRIQLDTNCLLVRHSDYLAICDTGFGTKLSDKERMHVAAEGTDSLVCNLKNAGIDREEITHVIFSHLHFDHAGGATQLDGSGNLELTFPNATHLFQKREMDDAIGNVKELEGSYYDSELSFLNENAKTLAIDGALAALPNLEIEPTGGHTFGHQVIWLQLGQRKGIYIGDLCPTSAHLNVFWTMAYDAFQLEVRRKKFELFERIATEKTIVFFDHDPEIQAATIKAKNDKSFEIDEVFALR